MESEIELQQNIELENVIRHEINNINSDNYTDDYFYDLDIANINLDFHMDEIELEDVIETEESIKHELLENEYFSAQNEIDENQLLELEYLSVHHEDVDMHRWEECAWEEHVRQKQQERRQIRDNLQQREVSLEGSRQIINRSGIRYIIELNKQFGRTHVRFI